MLSPTSHSPCKSVTTPTHSHGNQMHAREPSNVTSALSAESDCTVIKLMAESPHIEYHAPSSIGCIYRPVRSYLECLAAKCMVSCRFASLCEELDMSDVIAERQI